MATLNLIEEHLAHRSFLVGDRYGVADICLFGYMHVAPDAGLDLGAYPAIEGWLGRVASQPGHVNDLVPYPPNASPGAGRSIYD